MKENKIFLINIKEKSVNNEKNWIKCLNLTIKNQYDSKIIIAKTIYPLNVKYYLTKGPDNERINTEPYFSYIENNFCNSNNIYEFIKKENTLNTYIIDNFRYYDNKKRAFISIGNESIPIKNEIVLEFHIKGINNTVSQNIKKSKEYYDNEIMKLKNKINQLSDTSKKYDLIYLYASPEIQFIGGDYYEFNSPISYMEEIRSIIKLMEQSNKKFSCKFECADGDVFRETLQNNETKILHISAHGIYDENAYSLILENLKDKGQTINIKKDVLEYYFLNANKKNLNQIDLVIVSTCYGEDFGKLFLKYGVKNVIYIKQKTEIFDDISVKFTEYFYENLIKGKSIGESFKEAIKCLKKNKTIININHESCCGTHFHYKDRQIAGFFHEKRKRKKCNCYYEKPNIHNKDCAYYKYFENFIMHTKETVKEIKENVFEICCCDLGIEHDEINKIVYESNKLLNDEYSNIACFKLNPKGKLSINSNISFYFDKDKLISIKGRKKLMGKIFNSLNKKNKFAIFYGKKDNGKLDFAESLCVFLYERKIINNYEIFRISSKGDFNEMRKKIKKDIDYNKAYGILKKNVKIIKFDNDDDNNNFNYLFDIYKNYCNENINELFFIIIFNTNNKTEENNLKNIKEIKLIENENLFNAEYSYYYSKLLDYLIYPIDLEDEDKDALLLKAKNKIL